MVLISHLNSKPPGITRWGKFGHTLLTKLQNIQNRLAARIITGLDQFTPSSPLYDGLCDGSHFLLQSDVNSVLKNSIDYSFVLSNYLLAGKLSKLNMP